MKTNIRKLLCLLAAAAVILSGVFAATVQAAQPAAEADNFMNMVIFVRFSGETEDAFNAGNNFSAIYNMYNRTQSGGVDYSFKNYIKTISDGKLRVNCYMPQASADNLSVTPFSVSGAREDYSDEYDIITEVISAINNGQIIVDFAANKPDFTSAGYLDNLTLIVQGKASARDDYLTPHKYAYTGQAKITRQASGGQTDIGIYNYNLIDSDSLVDTSGSAAHIGNKQGVISHEFMHTLGLPDLYRNSGSGTPVGIWSIMASTSPYQQYPLSYSRHKLNWIESDSTDETSPGVFTLNKASAGEGSRLLLISTPLSESEFFAVEYRKKLTGTQASVGFETKIPESGLIIYRVNDSIEGKSNIAGNNYIYVFRPGVTDMDSADETDTNGLNLIWNAAVNPDNNEVSYGSTDLNAPFTDNTIYYSNGDNSGIRLYDIAYSPDGESISFKIEYGDYSTLGLWDDNASPGYGSDVAIAADGAGNVFAAWANDNNEVKVSRYSSSLWSDAGSFSDCFSPKLICYKDEIYLICAKGSAAYQCAVYKYTDGAFARLWQDTASASSIVGFAASDNSLYAAYVKDSGGRLVIKNALTGEVIDESLTGVYLSNPALAADEGAIYAVYSDIFSSTDNKAKVKKFNLAEGSWSLLKQFDLSSTNTHCCSVSNGKIYVLAANSSLSLCGVYNNGSWEDMPSPSFLENCFNTQLFTVGNTSYISYFNGSDKRAALMRLNSTIWERVGGNIAGAVASLNLCYARGCFWAVCSTEQTGEVFVRSKEIAVGAQSIAINTPDNSRVLELGSSMQLSAEITPLNADNREVIWSVENTMGEAAITEGGLLTALKAGNVTVKATASDGSGVFGEKVIEVINWSGQGDETSPYIITNAEQLDLVRTQLSAHYRLEGDIVFTAEDFAEGGDYYNGGKGWIPIGTLNEPFTGTLDGGSHGISGLTINSVDTVQSAAGLFGYISDCTIENLLISDMKISAGEYLTYAGGIAGSSQGNASTIVNCANTSDFSLKAMYAGGIIGHGGEADISRCYNAGAITAMNSGDTFYMGGITGVSFGGSITDCFNTGSITEGDLTVNCYMGSIAGQLTDATAANCYNTAPVNGKNSISSKAHILIGRTTGSTQVNNCYSLREPFSYITDEQTLTREQMLINSNFIGFDFDNVWTMEGNPTYSLPELADNPLRGNHITQIEITSPSERIDTSSQPLRLSATVTPQNADNKTLSWGIVGGNNRATLDKTGLFTPLKAGEVEVYAIADDTNVIYATKTVTIHEHHPGVTHIAVVTENGESELLVGDTMQLLAEVTPNEAEKAVTWSVVNGTGEAEITAEGLLTGTKAGSVTVKATAEDGSGVYGEAVVTIMPVKVATIGITSISNSVTVGDTLQMTAEVLPDNAENKALIWSIENGTGEATISEEGVLTGTKAGSVTVIATAKDGSGVYGEAAVTVMPVKVATIGITSILNSVTTGGTLQMTAEVLPENAENKAVTWSVENGTGEATISEEGVLTGTKEGSVTVIATAKDGSGVYGEAAVTIMPVKVATIGITSILNSVTVGGTLQMNAEVLPDNAENKAVTWSIENGTGEATISEEGLLTGTKVGSVTVKATAKDGSGVYDEAAVTVVTSQNSLDLPCPVGLNNITEVYIDGIEYQAFSENGELKVYLGDSAPKTAVAYEYNTGGIPVGMYVWTIEYTSGAYRAKYEPALKDLLSYHGFSVRIAGVSGIRFKTGVSTSLRKSLLSGGADGFMLTEYGTLVMNNANRGSYPLVKGGQKTTFGRAYYRSGGKVTDAIFETVGGRHRFASVLIDIPVANYKTQFAFRGYIILNRGGEQYTFYGPIVYRSIYYVSQQVLDSRQFPEGSSADRFLKKIITDADSYGR